MSVWEFLKSPHRISKTIWETLSNCRLKALEMSKEKWFRLTFDLKCTSKRFFYKKRDCLVFNVYLPDKATDFPHNWSSRPIRVHLIWESLLPDFIWGKLKTPGTPILMASIIPSFIDGFATWFKFTGDCDILCNDEPIWK